MNQESANSILIDQLPFNYSPFKGVTMDSYPRTLEINENVVPRLAAHQYLGQSVSGEVYGTPFRSHMACKDMATDTIVIFCNPWIDSRKFS